MDLSCHLFGVFFVSLNSTNLRWCCFEWPICPKEWSEIESVSKWQTLKTNPSSRSIRKHKASVLANQMWTIWQIPVEHWQPQRIWCCVARDLGFWLVWCLATWGRFEHKNHKDTHYARWTRDSTPRIMRMEDTLTDLWGILQDQEPSISPSNCVEVMHNEGWGILPGYYKYHLKLKILESQENSQTALTCLSTTAGRKERLQCGHGCKSSLKLLRMVGSLRPNHSFFKRTISKKIQVHFIRLINWVSMSFILYT